MPPDKGLANKMLSGVKGQKVRITYALTANVDGSEKQRLFTVAQKTAPMFAHSGKIGMVRSGDISKKSDIII